MLRFQEQALSHSYITIKKVTILFYGKFSLHPFIIGLKGDNEKIKGWGNDVQRVEYEDSVDVERIYHNTPE